MKNVWKSCKISLVRDKSVIKWLQVVKECVKILLQPLIRRGETLVHWRVQSQHRCRRTAGSCQAKFRKGDLGEIFYVTKGTEQCLFVYSREEWAKFEEKLASLPITTNPQAGAFMRFFLSGAAECEVDKLGRINIPAHLREYAHLEKDVKVLGVRSRIEIWDSAGHGANTARRKSRWIM